jgi:sialic acid synthase SpsE
MAVHVIAEAGSNYNGEVSLALQLNEAAAAARADSVKYQIIYPEGLYLRGEYAYGHYDIKEVWRIREEGVLTDDEWRTVCRDARQRGIDFSASVFDGRGLDLLCELDPPYIKTASCDLNNLRLLRQIAARGRTMVVSTGMSSLGDIEKAVAALDGEGISGEKLVLLHCVSSYPAALEETNLGFIQTLRRAFGTAVGFSDHTLGLEAACAAVALGATWIEKHFTVDRGLNGFDHKHALEPKDLAAYVAAVRGMEASMAPKIQKTGPGEAYTRKRARRGIYAARDLPAGHVIAEDDLLILRPEGPIPADLADDLLGARLKQALPAQSAFTLAGLEFPATSSK